MEKSSALSRLDVASQLRVMLLMLPSAARQTKATLRFVRDRGNSMRWLRPMEDLDESQRCYSDNALRTLDDFNPGFLLALSTTRRDDAAGGPHPAPAAGGQDGPSGTGRLLFAAP